ARAATRFARFWREKEEALLDTQTLLSALHPSVPAEVLAFAREQGVEQYLAKLIDLAREVYHSATRFDIFIEDDPEIANDRHIVFELDVPIDGEQARESDLKWHEGV